MSSVSTHVLDTARGRPASGVQVWLEREKENEVWVEVASGVTDNDGRVKDLLPQGEPGNYRLVFDTGSYFAAMGTRTFYPSIRVVFTVESDEHYHVPLLLSPHGYSTYRGT
jgi:5-hydroxyisourate hydrolase